MISREQLLELEIEQMTTDSLFSTEASTMDNMTVEELLRYVDRSHPQVKALAESLEIELENTLDDAIEVVNQIDSPI